MLDNQAHPIEHRPAPTSRVLPSLSIQSALAAIPLLWLTAMITLSSVVARTVLTQQQVGLVVAVALISTLAAAWLTQGIERPSPPALVPLVALTLAALIVTPFAEDTTRGWIEIALWGSTVLTWWAATRIDAGRVKRMLFALLSAAAVLALFQWIVALIGPDYTLTSLLRPESIFPNTNNLAAAMLPALALALKDRRWLWLGVSGLVLMLTASRASMLGATAGVAVYGAWRLTRRTQIRVPRWAIPSAALSLIVLIPLLMVGLANRTHGDLALRVDLWRIGVKAFAERPFTGYGPESYEYAFIRYWSLQHERFHHHAHSLPIQVAAEMGVIGLAALALLGITAARTIFREYQYGDTRRAVIAGAMFTAMVVAGTVDYVYWVSINGLIVMLGAWVLLHTEAETSNGNRRRAGFVSVTLVAMSFAILLVIRPFDDLWPRWSEMLLVAMLALALFATKTGSEKTG
jgi:O-antigen ligase